MVVNDDLDVRPMTGTIGAEVCGVDLSDELSEHLANNLRELLAQYQVIVFRDQHLEIDQQKALTAPFGPSAPLPYIEPMAGEPDVIRVFRHADEKGGVFGGDWHTDFSFLERPPAGSILCAVKVPPFGGDTLWASQAAAWDALPPPLQNLLLERDAIHVGKPYGVKWAPPLLEQTGGGKGAGIIMARGDPSADEERRHPAVLRHPVSGRKMLFLNPTYVTRLDGMTEEMSRPLLDQIQHHATRPEFCCRFRWSTGSVAIWDNLSTQHYAVNDYQGHERLMHRTTFLGPCPSEIPASLRQ